MTEVREVCVCICMCVCVCLGIGGNQKENKNKGSVGWSSVLPQVCQIKIVHVFICFSPNIKEVRDKTSYFVHLQS